jgi:hypothetical protein
VCIVALLPCTCRCLPAPPLPAETPSPQPPYPTLPSPKAASSLYLRLPEDAITTVSLTHRRWRTPLPPPLYPTPLSPEDTVATACLSSPPTEVSPPPPSNPTFQLCMRITNLVLFNFLYQFHLQWRCCCCCLVAEGPEKATRGGEWEPIKIDVSQDTCETTTAKSKSKGSSCPHSHFTKHFADVFEEPPRESNLNSKTLIFLIR